MPKAAQMCTHKKSCLGYSWLSSRFHNDAKRTNERVTRVPTSKSLEQENMLVNNKPKVRCNQHKDPSPNMTKSAFCDHNLSSFAIVQAPRSAMGNRVKQLVWSVLQMTTWRKRSLIQSGHEAADGQQAGGACQCHTVMAVLKYNEWILSFCWCFSNISRLVNQTKPLA